MTLSGKHYLENTRRTQKEKIKQTKRMQEYFQNKTKILHRKA